MIELLMSAYQPWHSLKGRWSWLVAPKGVPEAEQPQKSYKYPLTPREKRKKKKERRFLGNLEHFLGKFSLSLSFSKKHTQKPLISHLFPTIKRQCSCSHLPLLGLGTQDLRFRRCRCSFLAIIYTHLILQLFIAFFCFIKCFIDFPNISLVLSCFLACFIAFLACLLVL